MKSRVAAVEELVNCATEEPGPPLWRIVWNWHGLEDKRWNLNLRYRYQYLAIIQQASRGGRHSQNSFQV